MVEELADDGVHYQYQSDFDLLAVVKNEAMATKIDRRDSLHKRLFREIKTPVSLIAEDIHFVNRRISRGQYFYTDILREGIVLYDSKKLELSEPTEITHLERKKLAEDDFKQWFYAAKDFYKTYKYHYSESMLNLAAFDLHQTTERLYSTILLVFTRYKPNTHDLEVDPKSG